MFDVRKIKTKDKVDFSKNEKELKKEISSITINERKSLLQGSSGI